jgi:hypothetical protein
MTLLSRLAVVAAPSARTATAIEPKTPVYDALAAVSAAATFHEIRIARVRGALTPVGHHPAAFLSTAAIARGHIICF